MVWWFLAPWAVYVLLVAVLLFTTGSSVVSTTAYLHRGRTHGALIFSSWADLTFRGNVWITTGQIPDEWVAVHRKHHAHTDVEGDPHSPQLLGFMKGWFLNWYYYAREARTPGIVEKYCPRRPKEDAWDRHLFSWGYMGPITGILVLVALFGIRWGLAVGATHAILYVLVIAPLINALGHWTGYQNFLDNTAYNLSWKFWIWLTGGEGLHNNHHAFQKSPKFSIKEDEFDPGWRVICALERCKLLTISPEGQKALQQAAQAA